MAREQRRLGTFPRPLLGYAASDLALRRLRHRHVRRLGRGACRARGDGSRRPRPPPTRRRRRRHRLPEMRKSVARCARRAGARRLVRLRRDAGRAVPLSLRGQDLFERRFPADFICEAIDQTRGWFYSLLAVNTLVFGRDAVPQRRVPRAAPQPRRPTHVEVARDRDRPVDDPRNARSRRAPLELPLVVVAVDAEARSLEGIDESTKRFLVTLWETYKFFVTYANLDGWEPGMPTPGPEHARPRPVDPLTARRDRRIRHGVARSVRRAARRASARRLRRRPVELVRTSLAPALLERRRRTRRRGARDVARMPAHRRAPARAVLPVHGGRALRQPHRGRRIGAPRRVAGRTTARPRDVDLEDEMKRARDRGVARALGAERGEAQGSPAVAPRAGARARRRSVLRGGRARDRRRAQREDARARHQPRRPARLLGRARTSARSARRSGSGCRS